MHEAALVGILEAADEGFVIFDQAGTCVLVGRRLGELFGVERSAIIGGPEVDTLKLLASSCEEPEAFLAGARPGAQGGSVLELELNRPRLRMAVWHAHAFQHDGVNAGWIGVVRDVTRERSAERRAHQLSQRLEAITSTDALTQLPNRRRFLEELDREHGRAARAWDSYAILRIDVDGLGAINAEIGHPRGDEILEGVAQRLRDGRREYDVLARLENDEFIVLLPGADAHAAEVVANRMRDAVAANPFEVGESVRVSVAIGAAVWVPPSGEVGVDVVKRAGDALVASKRLGPGSIHVDAGTAPKGA
jgi:diguanylate cyclase (GGDEF)-like protein/PAS domain S-box-containing protein